LPSAYNRADVLSRGYSHGIMSASPVASDTRFTSRQSLPRWRHRGLTTVATTAGDTILRRDFARHNCKVPLQRSSSAADACFYSAYNTRLIRHYPVENTKTEHPHQGEDNGMSNELRGSEPVNSGIPSQKRMSVTTAYPELANYTATRPLFSSPCHHKDTNS